MAIIEETVVSLQAALVSLWLSFLEVFPGIVAAIVVVIVGGFVGILLGGVLTRILKEIKVDEWLEKQGLGKALSGLRLSVVLGSIIKWYIVVVFLGEAASLIKLASLHIFVIELVNYLPLLIGAFIVLMCGMIIGEYAKKSIVEKMDFTYKVFIAKFAKFLVVYFAIVIALQTAHFNAQILIDAFRIGFTALVAIVAVVAGVTFGLTFRKDAEKFWRGIKLK